MTALRRPEGEPCAHSPLACTTHAGQTEEESDAIRDAWTAYAEQRKRTPVTLRPSDLEFLKSEEFRFIIEKAFEAHSYLFASGSYDGRWDGSPGGIARGDAYSSDLIAEMVRKVVG